MVTQEYYFIVYNYVVICTLRMMRASNYICNQLACAVVVNESAKTMRP